MLSMNHVLSTLFDFDLDIVLTHVIQMVVAFGLVMPIGYHRENSKENIGLRTFPIVSLASCGFMLLAIEIIGDDGGMGELMAGIIGGIGFIGGGAILKEKGMVEGTSTAAAIWSAGCIGLAVAMGRLEIAVVVSVFTYLIFQFAKPIKKTFTEQSDEKD
ncbi:MULTISPECIES: MgtC/SapB family protein [unclassified Moraxella]|uniref:MgtC/SapB family protein n=1 Tax=unclassified Moraxella TaxID=2685852 RepID=UPI002B4165D6|nr:MULTISPECIES: MgtC/SapB family protein [unclassified Moraxella]